MASKRWSIRLNQWEDYRWGYSWEASVFFGREHQGTYSNVFPEYVKGRHRLSAEDRRRLIDDAKSRNAIDRARAPR
jgi:hypothetical protein